MNSPSKICHFYESKDKAMNSLVFSAHPFDISYSQVYSPSVSIERTHSSGVSLPPDVTVLVMLFSLAFGIIWYKKHRVHHFMIEQQRAMLERMWRLHSTK
jgi:hypothetical protein